MANFVYPTGKDYMLGAGDVSDAGTTVCFALVSSTQSANTNSVWSQVSAAAVAAASSPTFAGGTLAAGKFTTPEAAFGAVAVGITADLVMYISGTAASLMRLIAYFDTFSVGTHIVTNGGTVSLSPDASLGWFSF